MHFDGTCLYRDTAEMGWRSDVSPVRHRQRWANHGLVTNSSLKHSLLCVPRLKGEKTQAEDGQCNINVKFRRVRVLLLWTSNKYGMFWVCLCSLSYSSCKAHAPYYNVASMDLIIFFASSHTRHDFGGGGSLLNWTDFLYSVCLQHVSFYEQLSYTLL